MMRGETVFTGAAHPGTDLELMSGPAGYYLGFRGVDGEVYSRETPYWPEPDFALAVLDLIEGIGRDKVVAYADVLSDLGMLR